MAKRYKDLTGRTFGRLLAESYVGTTAGGHAQWLCLCSCGTRKTILSCNLTKGSTVSCGCFDRERRIKHGHFLAHAKKHPLYDVWKGMRSRCKNTNSQQYDDYGGRGITVCERWNSFSNFVEDMGERPPGYTIERKDNDGNYEPRNCKWASRLEQSKNQRKVASNRVIYHPRAT